MSRVAAKRPNRLVKFFLTLLFICFGIIIAWTAFSLIGRISVVSLIPSSAIFHLSVNNPVRFIDKIQAHESSATASVSSLLQAINDHPLLKKPLVRLAARGNLEFAILPPSVTNTDGILAVAWDAGFFAPLLRIIPLFSGLINIPNLYYVQAGKNSRFEYRAEDKTFFIGPYRNALFITDSSAVFESRADAAKTGANKNKTYRMIKPSAYDTVMLLSPDFIEGLLSNQDSAIAAVLQNIHFDSPVEAGLAVLPKKLELRMAVPVTSHRAALEHLIERRSGAPGLAERIPANAQYATILSAGTLEELYQAALVFSGPVLDESLKRADSVSRNLLRLSLDDLLYSWSGNEFAVFGMDGRPHPVYAIQVANERKRQEIFDKAFKSIVLNENDRLTIDGTRILRIETPEFLQSLLRRWNLNLPSPYYLTYRDYLLVSESAETLLTALRAMQKNDVLPKTAIWRNIAGGRAASTAFSLYYSIDHSLPFFLRGNTVLSGFLSAYRQGLLRMSFDSGLIDLSLAVIPGSGSGIMPVNGYPLDIGGRASNQVYGAGKGPESRIFLSRGDSAIAINPADNSIHEFSGQAPLWVIPAEGLNEKGAAYAWVVSAQGRVSLVNGNMEAEQGFPVLTGFRLSSPPVADNGKVYLCDQDGQVHAVDVNGNLSTWETSFTAALRSPPSFLSVQAGRSGRNSERTYAAVYPKSFFSEIWLLDSDGKPFPNWPVAVTDMVDAGSGMAFGSPLLFPHKNSVCAAFVTQAGELLLLDENAVSFEDFPLALDGVFYQQPVFDGDFLWLVSDNGTLFQVSLEGEVLYQQIPDFSVKEEGYITAFDCDGDKTLEIFITGEGNVLHAYSRNFRSLEGFPLPIWGRPFFIERSGNARPEIIGMGMDQRLYRWQFR